MVPYFVFGLVEVMAILSDSFNAQTEACTELCMANIGALEEYVSTVCARVCVCVFVCVCVCDSYIQHDKKRNGIPFCFFVEPPV